MTMCGKAHDSWAHKFSLDGVVVRRDTLSSQEQRKGGSSGVRQSSMKLGALKAGETMLEFRR